MMKYMLLCNISEIETCTRNNIESLYSNNRFILYYYVDCVASSESDFFFPAHNVVSSIFELL